MLIHFLLDLCDVRPPALVDLGPAEVEVESRERPHSRGDDSIAAVVLVNLEKKERKKENKAVQKVKLGSITEGRFDSTESPAPDRHRAVSA